MHNSRLHLNHLAPFNSVWLNNSSTFIITSFAKLKHKINNFHLHSGIVEWLNTSLEAQYLTIEGLKSHLKENGPMSLVPKYLIIKKTLQIYSKKYSLLEKVSFFYNKETEELIDNILTDLHSIEFAIRVASYPEKNNKIEDADLINSVSQISLNSIKSLNGSQLQTR